MMKLDLLLRITAALTLLLLTSGRLPGAPLVTQQAYLKASNTEANDVFGTVAVSGDTLVVGAWQEDSSATGVNGNPFDNSAPQSGAAYVYVRSGDSWVQQAYLKPSNTQGWFSGLDLPDRFGFSVAISGDTIVVGAPQEDSSATGVNGDQNNNNALDAGAAYVFVRNGTNWTQQAYLKASNTGADDNFGISVAISGDTIVVGAYEESSSATGINGNQANNSALAAGAAYVFVRTGTNWAQQAYLKASNTRELSAFGVSVATSGNTIVVGAFTEDSNASGVNGTPSNYTSDDSGAAYVFVRNGTTWTQQAYLKASNPDPYDNFGFRVSISADTIAVGALNESSSANQINGDISDQADNSASSAGAVYVFERTGALWVQQAYIKASNASANASFAWVAISGDLLVVGASYENSGATGINGDQNNTNAPGAGAAYLFVRDNGTWTQQAYIKASNAEQGDAFREVAISGNLLVVGALEEASSATGVNGDQSDNRAPVSGAAYVFTITLPPPLNIQRLGNNVVLSWTNAAFGLQSASTVTNTFTNIPGATSPYTNALSGGQRFFRLAN